MGYTSANGAQFVLQHAPTTGVNTFNFSTPTISTPQEVVPTTPTKVQGSDFGTNLFVIGLLAASLIVLIALALYARKIFNER